MPPYTIRLSSIVIILAASAAFVVPASYAQEHLFPVKGVVVDSSGAVIPQAEVVFKGESRTFIAHVSMNGSVNVNLEAGKYVVTISAFGFATTKLVDFSVSDTGTDTFRVSLKVDQSQLNYGSDFGRSGIGVVRTTPSELPDAIKKDEPTRASWPVAPPATTMRRSIRCIYLWRCSASQL